METIQQITIPLYKLNLVGGTLVTRTHDILRSRWRELLRIKVVTMTGSASKGNGGKYYYYHCSRDSKHLRCRADKANDLFARYIATLKPNYAILRLYGEIMKEINNDGRIATKSQITKIEEEVMAHEARLAAATNKFLDGEIDATLYTELKQRVELEKRACLSKLDMLKTPKCADVEPQLEYAMSLINNMEHHIREGHLEVKRELIGVMFPEKFDFDGKSYRTNSYNKVLDIIYQQTNELRGQKKRDSSDFSEKSLEVPLDVLFSKEFQDDLMRIWNLRFLIPDPEIFNKDTTKKEFSFTF